MFSPVLENANRKNPRAWEARNHAWHRELVDPKALHPGILPLNPKCKSLSPNCQLQSHVYIPCFLL